MQETVTSLAKANKRLNAENRRLVALLEYQGDKMHDIEKAQMRLNMLCDRLLREVLRIDALEQAVLDIANAPHIAALIKKPKFEPLFKKQDSEVV